jgi:hypothetical protein
VLAGRSNSSPSDRLTANDLISKTIADWEPSQQLHAWEKRARYVKVMFHSTKRGGTIMKSSLIIGIILIALGSAGLIYKGFSYESKETVAKIGSLEASADITKDVEIPQALSVILIIAGAGIVLVGLKK